MSHYSFNHLQDVIEKFTPKSYFSFINKALVLSKISLFIIIREKKNKTGNNLNIWFQSWFPLPFQHSFWNRMKLAFFRYHCLSIWIWKCTLLKKDPLTLKFLSIIFKNNFSSFYLRKSFYRLWNENDSKFIIKIPDINKTQLLQLNINIQPVKMSLTT